jgi:hypothetical protein
MWRRIPLAVVVIMALFVSAECSRGQQSDARKNAVQKRRQETERLRPLLDKVLPLRSQCDAMDPVSTLPIRGKVLAWAADYGYRTESLEPARLRAGRLDEPITVFLHRSLRHDRGWFFTHSNDKTQTLLRYPAYRQDIEICAIYWPENRVAGRILLEGGEPPMQNGQPQAEHGTPPDLAAWFDQQPVETR